MPIGLISRHKEEFIKEVVMLERMGELPDGIDGLRAEGKLTKDDCNQVIRPLLLDARRNGRRIRLLCEFAPEFQGFTAGAAWEDARIGLTNLGLIERCAVVSESSAIREGARHVVALLPCPGRIFPLRPAALDWLLARITPHLSHRLIPDCGVVVIEPTAALRPEDFDAIAHVVDPWIESHGSLHGVVARSREFPSWETVGAVVRHLQFVRDHRRFVHRVAVSTDSPFVQLMPKLGEHFVKAELRNFAYGELDRAITWAAA